MIEEAVVAILKARSQVTALVSTRIRPQLLQQGETMPAITYNVVDDSETYETTGGSGLHNALVDFVGWANDFATARNVAHEVRAALSGYSGGVGGVTVTYCRVRIGSGLYDSATQKYQRPVEAEIGYREG